MIFLILKLHFCLDYKHFLNIFYLLIKNQKKYYYNLIDYIQNFFLKRKMFEKLLYFHNFLVFDIFLFQILFFHLY